MGLTTLAFVHGINNGPEERAALGQFLESKLIKFGLGGVFNRVHVVEWPSVGDFMLDLAKIKANIPHRDRVLNDVMGGIVEASQNTPTLVVLAHSFGQVWAVEALNRIYKMKGALPTKTALVTIGGPLGNRDPLFRDYLGWIPREYWNQPASAFGSAEWMDIRNNDDPIPVHPVFGYEAPLKAGSMRIVVPGTPTPFNPMKEHSSYFDAPEVYDFLNTMAKRLAGNSG